MNCENYLKLIDAFIEDDLDEQTADEVSLHLVDCENCTAHFELLEREKEVYSHYLFEIEPPPHLQSKFEARLRAEEKKSVYQGIFAFLRFNPVLMIAVVLILFVFGFVLLNLRTEKQPIDQANDVQPNLQPMELVKFSTGEKVPVEATPVGTRTGSDLLASATPVGTRTGSDLAMVPKQTIKPETAAKPIEIKQVEAVKKPELTPQASPQTPKIESEELKQIKQIQALELETAKQMEKVEMLLRSFRNSEPIEGGETYDVAYESRQARQLLQTNVALRQRAEDYGNLFTGEMLGKVEPYLLDIANLDAKPSPEQVLEIKERVRNQNIIASLQVF